MTAGACTTGEGPAGTQPEASKAAGSNEDRRFGTFGLPGGTLHISALEATWDDFVSLSHEAGPAPSGASCGLAPFRPAPKCSSGSRLFLRSAVMRLRCLAALAFLAACGAPDGGRQGAESEERQVAPVLTGPDARDESSHARPEVARVTHVALDLDADFAARRLAGTATLDIEAVEGASEIVLDSKGLEIESIADGEGRPLSFALGAGDERRGQPLTVRIGEARRAG